MATDPTLESIQVGKPRTISGAKPWVTGFLKDAVEGPVWLDTENLDGDGQADMDHHGGPHKAVCVYSASHYPEWRTRLNLPELPWGSFGENFTVGELTEQDVCIGDVWSVGGAVVEVSQPRQPCWKLARRWDIKDLALQVQNTGRTGWYFRVLTQGVVSSGMPLVLVNRCWERWTVAEANRVMHIDKRDLDAAAQLAAIPQLSPSWKATLRKRMDHDEPPDESKRLGN
ncbi:6-N-hydroxylaminopurine resistance protein [Rubripirellula lacrimiformis]|uniref:6-N-hydroxylaminopurine resistance protein n=1 Tax=Rubripirellula lacrimiformis TaxID=1930273 RepID=A0A517NCH4_9BACT|nr:MOSC domain-containing protein [Rubripirellula lacrimiformis]QDT04820.1 6-N-hydroxylaminopurine resistance protein [Rubripirellula lacrimiformis]